MRARLDLLAPRPLSLALALAGAACAHAPEKMSFREAGLVAVEGVEPEGPVTPPVRVPAPRSIAAEVPDGPPIDGVLVRFAADARARRGRLAAAGAFPEETTRAWESLDAELDAYLARALPQTPLLELVRARVTIEAEWDYDLRRFGAPPEALRRAQLERDARFGRRIEAARALGLSMFRARAPARLAWPIAQAGISSPFGVRIDPLDGHHRMHAGVDLAAEAGRVVGAAARGYVVRAGWTGGYGLMVEVRHAGDVTTRYSHLSALLCAPGDAVDPGQPLGLVGKTGRATGPHLHFEVWRAGQPRDPLAWLGAAPEGDAGN